MTEYGYDRSELVVYELVTDQKTELTTLHPICVFSNDMGAFSDCVGLNDVATYQLEMQKAAVEKCYVFACDVLEDEDVDEQAGKYVAYACLLVSVGNDRECYAYRKQIAAFLCMTNAEGFAVVHNHPSGNPHWSEGDREDAIRLKEFGDILGVPLVEDAVVASGGCSSALYQVVHEFDNNK